MTPLLLALLGLALQNQPELPGRLEAANFGSQRVAAEIETRLESARIEIRLQDGTATVHAGYGLTPGVRRLNFAALRFEGQTVSLLPSDRGSLAPAEGGALRLSTAPGLTRLRAAVGTSGEVTFAYRVTGGLERIPLFVPPWPTVPGEERVEIRVLGLVRGGESFPKLVGRRDGSFQARLDNLPSFVRLPATDGGVPLNRVFDALVVAVALLGAGFWVSRHLASRSGSTGAQRPGTR